MPRIHILKPGAFRDCKGKAVNITAADCRQIARDYRSNTAPLIVGHSPPTDAPAHGWATNLSVGDRGLFADLSHVSPEMQRANAEKRYTRCSSRLVRNGSGWRLSHIGMLGAREPAVPDLDQVELAAGDDDPGDVVIAEAVDLATEEQETDENGGALTLATRAVNLAREALDAVRGRGAAGGGSTSTGDDDMTNQSTSAGRQGDTELAAQLEAERERSKKLEERLAAVELASKRSDASASVTAAVDAGRLLPRDAEPMTALLAAAEDLTVAGEPLTVELAAAGDDDESRSLSASDYLSEFLGRLPVQVLQGEVSGREPGTVELAGPGAPTNRDVDRRARELQSKDSKLGYGAAAVQAARELEGRAS